jgi:hypothetical protein
LRFEIGILRIRKFAGFLLAGFGVIKLPLAVSRSGCSELKDLQDFD